MSQDNDDFDYKIGDDDEEEEAMYAGDEIYSDSSNAGGLVGATDGEELDFYATKAQDLADIVKWTPPVLRQRLFEENMKAIADDQGVSLHDLIISCDVQDEGYIELIAALYPALEKYVRQVANPSGRSTLVQIFGTTLSATVWNSIVATAPKKNLSVEKFCALANSIYGGDTFQPKEMEIGDFVKSVAMNPMSASLHDSSVVAGDIALLQAIVEGADVEQPAPVAPPSLVLADAPEIDPMEVDNVVKAVLKVYDNLYAPCFINRPLGVLTPNGILKLEMDGSMVIHPSGISYAKRFYKYIDSQTRGYLGDTMATATIDSSFISAEGKLLTTYSPVYHLKNINGIKDDGSQVKTWTEFRRYLAEDLTKKVSTVLSKVETEDTISMQSVLLALFTNCVIMDKFDVTNSMKMRVKVAGQKLNLGNGVKDNAESLFGKDLGEVVFEGTDNVGIYDLLYVFDIGAYTSEILFSYKAHESLIQSGNTPSISNVVVGKGLDGKDITVNLGNESNVLTGIIAGSGSGKGVLTLNILASLFAEGCPVMYLDFKPDMAGTLWQMERYLQGKGYNSRIFALDAKEDRRKDGATPIRSYPYGYNQNGLLPLTTVEYGLFPYLKTLQFAVLLATARTKGTLPRKEKMFFILDETQGFSRSYLTMLKKLQDFERSKGKNSSGDDVEFAKKLANAFGSELRAELGNLRDVTGRAGLIGLILLGQKVDPNEWQVMYPDGSSSSWKDSFAAQMMGSLNLKFLGKGAGTSPSYGLGNVTIKGKGYIDDKDTRGYWAISGHVKATNDNTSIFKSYLTLNDNDFNPQDYASGNMEGMPYTGGVLGGISDAVVRDTVINNEFLLPDGSIRDTIGFLGLMKLIGGADEASLAEKVSRGYNQMEVMFKMLGLDQRYSCVEEYLYDCSPDSVFTYSELKDMMTGDSVDSVDAPSNGVTGSKDWMGETQFSNPASNGSDSPHGSGGGLTLVDDDDTEIPDMLDGGLEEPNVNSRPQQTANPASQFIGGQRSPVEDGSHIPTSKRPSGYDGEYAEQMILPNNPFRMYGTSDKPVSAILSIRQMSKYLMDEILRFSGDYGRIESMEVTTNGLVINNVAFRPRFEDHVIESMPFDIRNKVASGNVVELFHFENLRKFRNLVHLRIDNSRLAEGRVRREIGLSPRKTWAKLFDWFHSLNELYIGGERITDQETAQAYDDRGRGGFSLTEKLRNVFGMGTSIVSNSRMERVWDSKPVRVMTGAVGWTVGVKAVALAASLFGPWGLLFGAFAGYGAYRELKKRREVRK